MAKSADAIKNAQILYDNNGSNVCNNRAYYSVFYAVKTILAIDGIDYKKHSGVIQYFQKEYIKTGKIEKEYSKILALARETRNLSDYKDYYEADREEALVQRYRQ